ncbi:hypothetical protein [Noviherbaspirillum malthae]|uniref:hypothetical protein n=1 Tax=Noviherbaspirillum malthae TaxID=1260987 RepID=UPI00188F434F|nr:hypothetical protein [Noviherbaspirillum malthae]
MFIDRLLLYDQGVSVGVFKTPMGALERIGNDWLTHEYLLLVSGTDTSDDSSGYPASEP